MGRDRCRFRALRVPKSRRRKWAGALGAELGADEHVAAPCAATRGPHCHIFVSGLTLLASLYLVFGPDSNLANIKAAALTNRYNGADGRGLGWFCLFVAITAVPVSVQTLQAAASTSDIRFGLCCAAWVVLWLLFFIPLVMEKPIARFVAT
jgi:hypothetical protein